MRSDELHREVQAAIQASAERAFEPWSEEDFDGLARALFAHQFEGCSPYRHYCEVRGVSPQNLNHWTDIPAVPTEVFRTVDLCTFPTRDAALCFLTSGTTSGAQGRHFLRQTSSYEASLGPWLDAHLLPRGERPRILVLAPSSAADPNSSLSFMLQWAVEQRGAAGSAFCWSEGLPDLVGAMERLRAAAADGQPVLVLGTARALQALLEGTVRGELEGPLVLPEGSRIMETGGFKGATATLDRDAFYRGLSKLLGVPVASIISEYGMTELGSQGYQPSVRMATDERLAASCEALLAREPTLADPWGIPRLFLFPPWCRVRAVDPHNLALLPEGAVGLLRFWDLSNVDSIQVVQTADVGRVLPEGIVLEGRALGASPRGCSLAVDEVLAAAAGQQRGPRGE